MSYDKLYVGGEWIEPRGDPITVTSPHDGSTVAQSASASFRDIDRAVDAARAAFDEGPWPDMQIDERIATIERFAALYAAKTDEMAALISSENGSPLLFSQLGQVGGLSLLIQGFIEAAREMAWSEEVAGLFGPYIVRREPVGVVAAISAFNIPQVIILGKLIPALLAGCSVVVKPSPETPLDGLLLAEIIHEAGLPPGTVNILPGNGEAGHHLVAHPGVDHVTFTGSTAVGKMIGRICGEQVKRMTLELGGKSAAILLDDADVPSAVEALRFASFINNGQACAAQTRVLAPRSRYREIVEALTEAIERFNVGDPMSTETEIGPVVSKRQQEKVLDYIRLGVSEGARIVVGGDTPPDGLEGGCYVRPTLFVDATNDMRISREEIFGPVLTVIPFEGGDEEAVKLANDSPFGLAGSVYSTEPDRGMAVAQKMRAGTVGYNRFGPELSAPFGGFKESGVGREYGLEGLRAFCEVKNIHGL